MPELHGRPGTLRVTDLQRCTFGVSSIDRNILGMTTVFTEAARLRTIPDSDVFLR